MRAWPALVFAALLAATGACGGISSPSDNRIEDLSGTLQVAGRQVHQFSSGRNGEYSIRITALSPDSNTIVGVSFGQVFEGVCQLDPFSTNNFATLNRTALTGAITRGTFCTAVFDVGALTVAQTYTLQVSHP
jgi:hypothetical protein